MKKLFVTAILATLFGTFTMQAGDRPVRVEQLPQKAQQFIKTYFADVKVSYAKYDADLFDSNYDVIFVDGTKVEFRRDGSWKNVDCQRRAVPAGIVPEQIADFVASHHAESHVVEIDRDHRDIEVKLSNGAELTFDLKYNLKYYD